MNSKELLAAKRKGAEILHNGAPVEYRPRAPHDRKPWIWFGHGAWKRYSAVQCQAYYPPKENTDAPDGD